MDLENIDPVGNARTLHALPDGFFHLTQCERDRRRAEDAPFVGADRDGRVQGGAGWSGNRVGSVGVGEAPYGGCGRGRTMILCRASTGSDASLSELSEQDLSGTIMVG